MSRTVIIYALITAFLAVQCPQPLWAGQDTDAISQQLKRARSDYYDGKFEEAQQTVLAILKDEKLSSAQKFEALIILAEIRHALNDESGARKIIGRILEIKPDYNPSIKEEPPSFVALVQDERQKRPQEKPAIYRQKNFWIISGAAIVGSVGLILLSGGKSHKQNKVLPEPPNWPE